jgi:hypothetical protein
MSRLLCGVVSIVTACSGTKTTTTTTDDTDDPTVTTVTGDTSVVSDPGLDPVAVGFELAAQMNSDGSLGVWRQGTYEYIPLLLLTFADVEYFSTSDQEGHYCTAFAPFGSDVEYGGIFPLGKPDQVPVSDGAIMYWSYDVALNLQIDPDFTDCDELVDPEKWGENAELLLEPFVGAHVGIGFAPMTDYLREAWAQEVIDEYDDSFLAMYIAINDASGDFIGFDWTSALIWETDPDTGEVLIDENGYLANTVPVDGLLPGGDLPVGQVQSYAYWYQDFPLMDFSNLRDGAP